MSKLIKLPSLVAKCCKIRKIYACEVCKFCTLLYYAYPQNGRNSPEVRPFCGKRNTNIQNLQTLQAYIFHVLQYFVTKLGSFTNFNMLFLASVKDFDFFAKMKIQFKRGMVH